MEKSADLLRKADGINPENKEIKFILSILLKGYDAAKNNRQVF